MCVLTLCSWGRWVKWQTHRPSSQGWAPGVLPCCCVQLCCLCLCMYLGGGWGGVYTGWVKWRINCGGGQIKTSASHLWYQSNSLLYPLFNKKQQPSKVLSICFNPTHPQRICALVGSNHTLSRLRSCAVVVVKSVWKMDFPRSIMYGWHKQLHKPRVVTHSEVVSCSV